MATISEVIAKGAEMFCLHPREILEDNRWDRHVRARFALYAAFRNRGASFGQIGRWMHRDHTSVMNGVKRAAQIAATDQRYADCIKRLTEFRAPEADLIQINEVSGQSGPQE
jgi:chromosomal replication initiation ATPase DnaA